MKIKLLLFLAVFFGVGFPASADILFLTFNPAPGEVRAAREGAKARGEELFVLPRVPATEERRLESLEQEEAALIRKAEKEQSDDELNKISERMIVIQDEKENILNAVSVTPASLLAELRNFDAKNIRFSTVILSGHDGNGKFWGSIGKELNSEELRKAFMAVPRLAQGVRSVALLGCYTTNIGSLDTHWKTVFPEAKAFGGYEQKGPLAHVPMGHEYLKAFLSRDRKFAQAKTKQEMLALFKDLPQIRNLAASLASDHFHVSHRGVKTIEELYESCRNLGGESTLRKQFTCYYEARSGCDNVPKDTKAGALRKFYEELQANAHCKEMLTVDADHSLPRAEAVLSLIFFENIKGNFFRLHQAELQELDKWMYEAGVEPLDLTGKERNRAQLLKDIRQARMSLMKWGRGLRFVEHFKLGYISHAKAAQRLAEVDKIILTLMPGCAPSAWVDPLVTTRSSCLTKNDNLQLAAEKAWDKGQGVRK